MSLSEAWFQMLVVIIVATTLEWGLRVVASVLSFAGGFAIGVWLR